jgi:hypothetical protein
MVISSMMTNATRKRIIAEIEAQGARARETKRGILIYAADGATRAITAWSSEPTGLRNDVAWFRAHGLHHPADKKELEKTEVAKKAETNEEGYPLYMVGPINQATRKRVLSELERRGWPLRVKSTEITMDTVTASRALYNVGYRWDPDSPARERVWMAPEDIQVLHERVKSEMKRREEEARAEREFQRELQAICDHESWEMHGTTRKCADCGKVLEPLPDPDEVEVVPMPTAKRGGVQFPKLPPAEPVPSLPAEMRPMRAGMSGIAVPFIQPRKDDYALTPVGLDDETRPEPAPAWIIDYDTLPEDMTIRDLARTMRAIGVTMEITARRDS